MQVLHEQTNGCALVQLFVNSGLQVLHVHPVKAADFLAGPQLTAPNPWNHAVCAKFSKEGVHLVGGNAAADGDLNRVPSPAVGDVGAFVHDSTSARRSLEGTAPGTLSQSRCAHVGVCVKLRQDVLLSLVSCLGA